MSIEYGELSLKSGHLADLELKEAYYGTETNPFWLAARTAVWQTINGRLTFVSGDRSLLTLRTSGSWGYLSLTPNVNCVCDRRFLKIYNPNSGIKSPGMILLAGSYYAEDHGDRSPTPKFYTFTEVV